MFSDPLILEEPAVSSLFHSCAMSFTFSADMGTPALVAQLNAMREELSKRFDTNEKNPESVRAAIEIFKADQSDLGGHLANVQQGLAVTTDQARQILEKIITDSRAALIEVRGEGLLALQAVMTQHEEALQALHTTLTDQVRFDLLGIRTGCNACAPPTNRKRYGCSDESASALLRKDPWAATAPSVSADTTGVSLPEWFGWRCRGQSFGAAGAWASP